MKKLIIGLFGAVLVTALGALAYAVFTNGGFEDGNLGSWNVARYLNNNVTPLGASHGSNNLGLLAVPPALLADLNLSSNAGALNTAVVGGPAVNPETLTDVDVGAGVKYPKYGHYSAVINGQNSSAGWNRNGNSIKQTMQLGPGDIDSTDGQLHVRFVVAPVLENPNHYDYEQPYFFVQVRNCGSDQTCNTTPRILYTNFNFAGQTGVPWKTQAGCPVNGGGTTDCQYTDWQLVDVPMQGSVQGDYIEMMVYAVGCSRSGHFGRVYVDAFGSVIPGLYVSGTAPAYAVENTDITYTLHYKNGGASTANSSVVRFHTPLMEDGADTAFQSVSLGGCTTMPAVGTAGDITCPVGNVSPNASGSFTVTVHIPAGHISVGTASTLLRAANYDISASGINPLLGSKVETRVSRPPNSIAVVSGSPQTKVVNTAFTNPLVVVVKDINSAVVPGVTVTFVPPVSGASATFTGSTTTDVSGQVSLTATANTVAGGPYSVSATVPTAGGGTATTPIPFSLTNTPGTAASVFASSGSPQSTKIGTPFANRLVALVRDQYLNPVPNASVTFTPPGTPGVPSAAIAGPSPVVTDAAGLATTGIVTANTVAGAPYAVTATVAGVGTANFSLQNTPGDPATISINGGTPQSRIVLNQFATPLGVRVVDSGGNPVPGVVVTYQAFPAASGASATFNPPPVTDANGQVNLTVTANSKAGGPYKVTATAAGVATGVDFWLTNLPGAPTKISIASGSPQTQVINTAFGSPLVALVTDDNDNPVQGASVTFTPPGPGVASASITEPQPSTTDALGHATVQVTANSVAGSYQVAAQLGDTGPTANFSLTNTPGPPNAITVVSGNMQETTVHTAFAAPLVVLVQDAGGNPVSVGTAVTFTAPASGASTQPDIATAMTDIAGQASLPVTANDTAGGYYSVIATSGSATSATFSLKNDPGVPEHIAIVGGSTPQSTQISQQFAAPLVALVTDHYANPVPGASVTFTPPAAPGVPSAAIPGSPATTDTAGHASVIATANTVAGPQYSVDAMVGAVGPVSFLLTNLVGPAGSISVVSGSSQSTQILTDFAQLLVVKVVDAGGNPVPGVAVTFAVPAAGASAAITAPPPPWTTDASGEVSVTATANSVAGRNYMVSASAASVAAPTLFTLTNTPGPAASVSVSSGDSQSAQVLTAFAQPLIVVVQDAHGNPVPSVAVTFLPPGSEPSAQIVGSPVMTDALGHAGVTATADAVDGGPYSVSAWAAGVSAPAIFSLTNTSGTPGAITIVSGGGQSTDAGTAFPAPIVVLVTDAHGNPVSGVAVTLTLPSSGPGATASAVSLVTDANGQASVQLTANGTAGTFDAIFGAVGAAAPLSVPLTITSTEAPLEEGGGNNGGVQAAACGANNTSGFPDSVACQFGTGIDVQGSGFASCSLTAGAAPATPATSLAALLATGLSLLGLALFRVRLARRTIRR